MDRTRSYCEKCFAISLLAIVAEPSHPRHGLRSIDGATTGVDGQVALDTELALDRQKPLFDTRHL